MAKIWSKVYKSASDVLIKHTLLSFRGTAMMKKSNTVKVTMNLTDRDVENTDKVREAFHARSNAAAVSDALSVTATLATMIKSGKEILVRNKKGEIEKLVIAGVE